MLRYVCTLAAIVSSVLISASVAYAAPANVRLSNDVAGGYVSGYTLATGFPYTDQVISECSMARGRQNEPSVEVDPRDTRVLIGSSNDYCGVYAGSTPGNFVASGPIWLGYYRSENGGGSFQSSLVPGYPGDTSPYAALAAVRTASAGDPVIAWDSHGRVFLGAESSEDRDGTKKTLGDVWVARYDNPGGENGNTLTDGKRYLGSVIVARGSSAPNLLGKFNDKTAIEADRTGGPCDGSVYFAWSRFTGNSIDSNIYFSRSTDHGASWSKPMKLTPNDSNLQDPDISVTGNGNVYVTYVLGARTNGQPDGVAIVKSSDCGKTFGKSSVVTTLIPYGAQDVTLGGGAARDCGDLDNACLSGFTFFRRDSSPRSTADQSDQAHEWVYIVYDASKPGTETSTGNSYGSIASGTGSQSGAYFVRYDGATGVSTAPALIDDQAVGHQVFPDISADGGVLRTVWWDSRTDPCYSPARPVGNCADGTVVPSLMVIAAVSTNSGATWGTQTTLSSVLSNPNYEQFSNRTVPFAGDYLWITSRGSFSYATWTDWRDVVPGTDPREDPDENDGADVLQCRTFDTVSGTWGGDQCPRDGGLDQNIYGAQTP